MKALFLMIIFPFFSPMLFPQASVLRNIVCMVTAGYQTYMGEGSGFVMTDSLGNNYITTNHHVVDRSSKISVFFRNNDDRLVRYDEVKILVRDEPYDLAILAFPQERQVFSQGLKLEIAPPEDGDAVSAAGFPSLVWQYSEGIVSNRKTMIRSKDGALSFVSHTASTDSGSSGGPLLVRRPEAPYGFSVVGVNTLKSSSGRGFSIPAERIAGLLNAASEKAAGRREEEPNDVRPEATAIELEETVSASLHSPEDTDWYCLTFDSGETSIEVDIQGTEDLEVEIYGHSEEPLGAERGREVRLRVQASGGPLFLKVRGQNLRYYGSYHLRAAASAGLPPAPPPG